MRRTNQIELRISNQIIENGSLSCKITVGDHCFYAYHRAWQFEGKNHSSQEQIKPFLPVYFCA